MPDFSVSLIDNYNNTTFESYIISSSSLKQANKEIKKYMSKTLFSGSVSFTIKPINKK